MSSKRKNIKQKETKEGDSTDGFVFVKQSANNVILEIMVKPNSKENEIQGIEEGLLKVNIAAPPVDGKANAEVISFMASHFKIKKSFVSVIKGQTSHHKTIQFENWTREKVISIIQSK